MAVITSVRTAATTNASGEGSLNVPIGPNDDGDLIVIAWQRFSNASTQPTATGFSNAASGVSGFSASGFIYKVNSGGTTSSPVNITWSATNHICAQSYVIKGQAASPIGANNTGGSSSTTALSATTTTTTAANSLILHSNCNRAGVPMAPTLGVFQPLGANNTGDTECAGTSGAAYVAASSATTPSFTWGINSANSCNDVVLEIKSATGSIPIGMTPGRTVLAYNGNFGTTHTWKNPNATLNSGAITSIDGVNMGSQTATISYTRLTGEPFRTTQISTASTATLNWEGGFETISTTDMTDKVICIPWGRSRSSTDRVGTKGCICVLVDTADNWVAYTLRSGTDGFSTNTRYSKFIKYGVTTALATGGAGTFDISSVNHIGYFWQGNNVGGDAALYVGSVWMEDSPTVFTGGSAAAPLSVEYIQRHLSSANQWPQMGTLQGTRQYLATISHQIGDASVDTYFKSTGQSFSFRDFDVDYVLGEGDVGLTLKGSADCTLDLSSSIIVGESLQNFTVDSGNLATPNLTGASFIGLNWATDDNIDYSGASFSNCNLVELGGGTVSDANIATPAGTTAATVSVSGGTLDGCTISATKETGSTDYHLTLGTAVTAIELNGVTFNGTPNTDKIHVLKTTGTVTITVDGTGTPLFGADVTSEGATVTIASPAVYQEVVVSGFTSGARVQIYDTTNSVELFNGTASSGNTVVSGTTATWTDPVAAAGNRAIRVRCSYVSGATAKEFIEASGLTCGTTFGTESITYPITQGDDTVYNNNAISGSTVTGVTFTDSAVDVMNIDVAANAISWKSIYAAWVYYAFGSTGIASDIDYIEAVDEANYILSNMVVKNTSSPTAPLQITGGYGRDSVTGAAIDLVDTTGGTIVMAPDHVVSYAVGSGVTAGDITSIVTGVWNAGTRTVTNTIPSAGDNAAAVLDEVVEGTTSLKESIRLQNAVLLGKVSGAGTGTEVFRDIGDTKDRVTSTVDTDGNRSAVTLDGT